MPQTINYFDVFVNQLDHTFYTDISLRDGVYTAVVIKGFNWRAKPLLTVFLGISFLFFIKKYYLRSKLL